MKIEPARICLLLVALLLLGLYFVPLWRIILFAPQYLEGVHMFIYIDKIGGSEPGTLQNINILNHYVGMKMIVPESIPELKWLPIGVGVYALIALIAAFVNKNGWYIFWAILFTVTCLLLMYDFYLWEYDYGHDLSPDAPIKVEGQSYQPPLIGSKTLLNFTAYSLPHIGGWFVIVALILSYIAVYLKQKK